MTQIDYMVVGLGLAGSLVAHKLTQRGCAVGVIDDADPCAASIVAPGIINPLAGKRMHPSWRVEDQLPVALALYRSLSRCRGASLFTETPIVRILRSDDEVMTFNKRCRDPRARPFLGEPHPADWFGAYVHDDRGSFEANGSGFLNIGALCDYTRTELVHARRYRREAFQFDGLRMFAGRVIYKDWEASGVIFCEGWRGQKNPFFSSIAFKPAKGEMLTLRTETAFPEVLAGKIFNAGKWILPLGGNRFRAGATYGWDALDNRPTHNGRRAILETLGKTLAVEFEVIGHDAGVRPITRDYRPVLGRHPVFPQLAICNGFGSKGVLCGPWCAEVLVNHLIDNATLDPEIDVHRFF